MQILGLSGGSISFKRAPPRRRGRLTAAQLWLNFPQWAFLEDVPIISINRCNTLSSCTVIPGFQTERGLVCLRL